MAPHGMLTGVTAREREKYDEMWQVSQYRAHSPGLDAVARFQEVCRPMPHGRILDAGCGDGRAGLALATAERPVVLADLTTNAFLDEVPPNFTPWCLWTPPPWPADWFTWGFCIDVLEHVPTEFTMLAVHNLTTVCRGVYLEIATVPDQFGVFIGQKLHETVRPYAWWRERLTEIVTIRDARDLCGRGLFVVERKR